MAKSKNKLDQGSASEEGLSKKFKANSSTSGTTSELLYGKPFYTWMLIGVGFIVLGFILMAGGHQGPNEWNADEIYSFRRTAVAPIVILIGLIIEIYAIFKK